MSQFKPDVRPTYEVDRLLWVDLECTGLDPHRDQILEVGIVATDANLEPAGVRESYVAHPKNPITTSSFVAKMHATNGLWEACENSGCDIGMIDALVESKLESYKFERGKVRIAGSTVQFDKAFIAVHMPRTFAFFDHRVFDASTLKASVRMWTSFEFPESDPAHRALADIDHSIAVAWRAREIMQVGGVPSKARAPYPPDGCFPTHTKGDPPNAPL